MPFSTDLCSLTCFQEHCCGHDFAKEATVACYEPVTKFAGFRALLLLNRDLEQAARTHCQQSSVQSESMIF